MGNSSTLSFRVDDEIIDALDQMASESPASRSALAREAVNVGLQEMDGVPEWIENDAEARSIINENKRESWEGAFRSEVTKRLKSAFEDNRTPAEFEQSISGYIAEADRLGELDPGVVEDTPDGVDTFAEWVDYMCDYYQAAYQAQDWDHDPINDPLGNHEGVQKAQQWVGSMESIASAGPGGDAPVSPQDARKYRRQAARMALEDDEVPEHVIEEARKRDAKLADAVAEIAVEQVERDSAMSDTSNPELED